MTDAYRWVIPHRALVKMGASPYPASTRRKARRLRVKANARRRWERLYMRKHAALIRVLEAQAEAEGLAFVPMWPRLTIGTTA